MNKVTVKKDDLSTILSSLTTKYDNIQIISKNDDEFELLCDYSNSNSNTISDICTDDILISKISEILKEFGIPANLKGYNYIREAIYCAIHDTKMLNSVTKILYPTVAKKFNTTSSRVERAIRHGIESGWDLRCDKDSLYEFFGNTINKNRGKPTNSEFIYMIVDYITINYKNIIK